MFRFRSGNGADWLDLLAARIGRHLPEQVELLADQAALREAMHRAAAAVARGEQPMAGDVHVLQGA